MTLQEVGQLLQQKGYEGIAYHKSVRAANDTEIVAVELYCSKILMDDRLQEVKKLLPDNKFLLHKFPNTESIYIIKNPTK